MILFTAFDIIHIQFICEHNCYNAVYDSKHLSVEVCINIHI